VVVPHVVDKERPPAMGGAEVADKNLITIFLCIEGIEHLQRLIPPDLHVKASLVARTASNHNPHKSTLLAHVLDNYMLDVIDQLDPAKATVVDWVGKSRRVHILKIR